MQFEKKKYHSSVSKICNSSKSIHLCCNKKRRVGIARAFVNISTAGNQQLSHAFLIVLWQTRTVRKIELHKYTPMNANAPLLQEKAATCVFSNGRCYLPQPQHRVKLRSAAPVPPPARRHAESRQAALRSPQPSTFWLIAVCLSFRPVLNLSFFRLNFVFTTIQKPALLNSFQNSG